MTVVGLLDGLQDGLVDTEADGAEESEEGEVRDDADQWHVAEGEEDCHDAAEHDAGLLRVPPVHQGLHCNNDSQA